MELRLGSFVPAAPVVLAPMAGVTDASFRDVCRGFAPHLVYANEMVMSSAVVHGNAKTCRMMAFGADEHPRSLQLYGSDPSVVRQAVSLIGGRRTGDEHQPTRAEDPSGTEQIRQPATEQQQASEGDDGGVDPREILL